MTWLHFVGKQYYSRRTFEQEARRYGVTRRVALQTLARMNWGDRVLLAIKETATPMVFGTFLITRLSGLTLEATQRIMALYPSQIVAGNPQVVRRGCGEYTEAMIVMVNDAPLPQIARRLMVWKAEGLDIGKPMVGGTFGPEEQVYLQDIPHQQGFRAFDYAEFLIAVDEARWKLNGRTRHPRVRGQFYASVPYDCTAGDGELVAVQSYQRKGV